MFCVSVGHGHSEGDQVHVDDVKTYLDDIKQHADLIQKDYSDIPLFLLGHSMVSSNNNLLYRSSKDS